MPEAPLVNEVKAASGQVVVVGRDAHFHLDSNHTSSNEHEPRQPNNLPFRPNPHFTGREEMLEELRRRLAEKATAAITQPQAIHGLGGVGKTQLAVEYAWKCRSEYEALLWVVADSPENVTANLAALCSAAVLNLPEAAAAEQVFQTDAVRHWLRNNSRWLLIFDSVDSDEAADAVRGLLPSVLEGHVIITSRRRDWNRMPSVSSLPVDVLPEKAAADFLCERVSNCGFAPGQREDALKLARELGGLPLALEQAAAYVLRHCVTYTDYCRLFEECRPRLLNEEIEGGTHYRMSLAGTWLITEKRLSFTARAILRLAAFFAPDGVPRSLFPDAHLALREAVKLLAAERREKLPRTRNRLSVESALVELADHSMITLTSKAFSCHRLVQAVQGDLIPMKFRRRWVEHALQLMNEYAQADPGDARTWPVWDVLRAHVDSLVNYADRLGIPEPTTRLMNRLSAFLYAKALHREAEPLMRRALTIFESSLGAEHPNVATQLNNLAQLLQATNRLAEAEPLMRRHLEIFFNFTRATSHPHPHLQAAINNYASLLEAMGLDQLQIRARLQEIAPEFF